MDIKTMTAEQLADKFVTCKMNCSIEHNPTKILKLLDSNESNFEALRNFFVEEKERDDKRKSYEFERYYTKDIIEILDALKEAVRESFKPQAVFSLDDVVGSKIYIALKNNVLFRGFNWGNYSKLKEERLTSLIGDFDCDFRGDITAVHYVGGKYVVIQTQRMPFDKKAPRVMETCFYSTEVRKNDRLYLTNFGWDTFEAALFHTMAPSQSSAMHILFEASKK